MREVRAAGKAKVALFSNASTRLEADLETCGLDVAFDVVFNSARLGLAKPDPKAFLAVAPSTRHRPATVPVRGRHRSRTSKARVQAGMQAEQFTGQQALRSLLERAGLL